MSELKISCAVAEDLLPLYHDGVCSKESRALVEEHVAQCGKCAALLKSMNEPEQHVDIDDAAPLKSIEKEWKKGKIKSKFNRILSALIALIWIIGMGYWGLDQYKVIPVSADVMEISERYQLSDGRIVYRLNVTDGRDFHFTLSHGGSDGNYYLTPMRSIVEGKRPARDELFQNYFLVDIPGKDQAWKEKGYDFRIARCYLGTEDDNILLWEEGMEIPAASEELERMVRSGEISE